MRANPLVLFLRLSRPLFLLGGVLNYALGLGIARYLGVSIEWNLALLGQLWVSSLQLATHYLNEYFDYPGDALNPQRTPFSGGSGVLGAGPGQLRPVVALAAAYSMLTLTALVTLTLLLQGALSPLVSLLLLLIALGAVLYSVPPVRLASSGYGELTTVVLLANLLPALGFALQAGELHRLLALSTFPLTMLTFASMLALEFPDYASDLRVDKQTLLVRLGWQRGLQMHHACVFIAYALFAAAFVAGLPAAIAFPPWLSLPLALMQVWYLGRIGDGMRPHWSALTLNAVALSVAATYLLAYSFWTR